MCHVSGGAQEVLGLELSGRVESVMPGGEGDQPMMRGGEGDQSVIPGGEGDQSVMPGGEGVQSVMPGGEGDCPCLLSRPSQLRPQSGLHPSQLTEHLFM